MIDLGQIGQITKTFRSSSAVIPALIWAAVFGPLCILGSLLAPIDVRPFLLWMAIAAMAFPALQILFFTIFDRDRLQNEQHVENKLLIAQGKAIRGDRQTVIEISDEEPVENPALEDRRDV